MKISVQHWKIKTTHASSFWEAGVVPQLYRISYPVLMLQQTVPIRFHDVQRWAPFQSNMPSTGTKEQTAQAHMAVTSCDGFIIICTYCAPGHKRISPFQRLCHLRLPQSEMMVRAVPNVTVEGGGTNRKCHRNDLRNGTSPLKEQDERARAVLCGEGSG